MWDHEYPVIRDATTEWVNAQEGDFNAEGAAWGVASKLNGLGMTPSRLMTSQVRRVLAVLSEPGGPVVKDHPPGYSKRVRYYPRAQWEAMQAQRVIDEEARERTRQIWRGLNGRLAGLGIHGYNPPDEAPRLPMDSWETLIGTMESLRASAETASS